MMSELFKIPSSLMTHNWDWRIRVAESCPLINTAIRYAENTKIPVKFIKADPQSDVTSTMDALRRDVTILHSSDITDCLRATTHELKHVGQLDAEPIWTSWFELHHDIDQSLSSDKCHMQKEYSIPSLFTLAALRITAEVDAHTYSFGAEAEAKSAYTHEKIEMSKMQPFIDRAHKIIYDGIGGNYADWIRGDLVNALTFAVRLLQVDLKFGMRPAIHWVETPHSTLQNMMMPFWAEAGYKSPLFGPAGMEVIQNIKTFVEKDTPCQMYVDELEGVLRGQASEMLVAHVSQAQIPVI